jgi:hypothetical protein
MYDEEEEVRSQVLLSIIVDEEAFGQMNFRSEIMLMQTSPSFIILYAVIFME